MFNPFVISGMGVISAFGEGNLPFSAGINSDKTGIKSLSVFNHEVYEHKLAGEIENFNPKKFLAMDKVRGFNRQTLILMESTEELFRSNQMIDANRNFNFCQSEEVSICIGTSEPTQTICECDFQVIEDPQFVQPSLFPGCVACASAGYLSIKDKIKSSNITLTNGESSSLDSFQLTSFLLHDKEAMLVICGGVEELSLQQSLLIQNKFVNLGLKNPVLGEGSAVFSCETYETVKQRNGKVLAEVIAFSSSSCPDLSESIKFNLNEIEKIIGKSIMDQISDVFGCEDTVFDNIPIIENKIGHPVKKHTIQNKIGYLAAASGSFKIAAALVSDAVKSGSYILINDLNQDGSHSSLVIKKV